ncbi:MAG: NRAMP family divalent metal transporter [Ktedonobacterales bacterium]
MKVEAAHGDLGERDVSKPTVRKVIRDRWGDIRKIVVAKGVLFRKKLVVPVERVSDVAPPSADEPGKVLVATKESEIKNLTARGRETLSEEASPAETLLEETEEVIPTVEGVRRNEARNSGDISRRKGTEQPGADACETEYSEGAAGAEPQRLRFSLRMLGPGLLAGMAGNDSSAVTSYSVNGATNGYGQLWLLLLATPLYQSVQYACAKIGRVSQQGLATLLREQYGRRVAVPASVLLLLANGALIAADLAAIGSGLQLVTGISWHWFVVPVALILWYLTVYQSFGMIKKVFIGMSLAFVAYLITGIFSGANWGMVLKDTFIPQINLGFAGISSAVALLGATVSPYTMYWQVQGEKEEKRPGSHKTQFALASADIGAGTISGNLVAYFIIVCTSATLFTHHQQIRTAADAAGALEPLAGPFATYLFAIGLIGAGLVAIPVLLASSSYAVAGTFGWPASLWKKPWQNEGFYVILTAALSVSLVVALLGFDPIELMFWANVLQGVLAPSLVVLILLLGNKRAVMKGYRFGKLINVALVLIALIMFAAVALLFYGLLTGHAH